MKAGRYEGPQIVKVATVEKPPIKEHEALIQVSYAGICGTDMFIYSGKHPRAKAPLIMGHEFAGYVVALGNSSGELAKGDRVVIEPLLTCGKCAACSSGQRHVCTNLCYIGIDVDGGFADYAVVPMSHLRRLPDQVSDKEAAMIEPLAVAIHTVRRSSLKVGDVVVILGAGPIGLLVGLMAKKAGASEIFISDVSKYRLDIAEKMGFKIVDASKDDVVQIVKNATYQLGADIVFEVAGNQVTANQMVKVVKFQGEIVVVSVYKSPPTVDLAAMHFRELSLTTTRCYEADDFSKAIQMLERGAVDLLPLVSHILPLESIREGFEYMNNPEISLKVLFHPEKKES
ncbi:zinc-dependent alcohol dehydrogenase [Shouchella clausii]|uniref:zinc-dependent alcohol dehydrogenase n=1 Tax=Shouchella clausii TaxID=79880 RepID=UPI000BA70BF0|nr:alcohol dehydrogenase catalytic domain-containing protein [Shouchella clausii]PAD16193.1 zinc-binding dehydrogenase [Shouchella clausii]